MIGVKDQSDRRDSWHHGGWMAKMVIWILLIILAFFLPNVIISIYGQLLIDRFSLRASFMFFCLFHLWDIWFICFHYHKDLLFHNLVLLQMFKDSKYTNFTFDWCIETKFYCQIIVINLVWWTWLQIFVFFGFNYSKQTFYGTLTFYFLPSFRLLVLLVDYHVTWLVIISIIFLLLWSFVDIWATFCSCRNFMQIWGRLIFTCSSAYPPGLYSFMEWCLGWERWTEMVSSNIIFHYFNFAACILMSNFIPGCTLGMLLYLLYQLDATLRHLYSLDFCSFGSTPLVTTAASMSSSLWWRWFWHLHLLLLP